MGAKEIRAYAKELDTWATTAKLKMSQAAEKGAKESATGANRSAALRQYAKELDAWATKANEKMKKAAK